MVDVAADGAQHVVIEPGQDFLFNKLLLTPVGGDCLSASFPGLTVESVRVGRMELLPGPMPAVFFTHAQVYPGPEMPKPKDPMADIKKLFIGMWNVMNDRPARDDIDEDEDDVDKSDVPAGTSLPDIYVRPDQSIEINLRNDRAQPVTLALSLIGTVFQK